MAAPKSIGSYTIETRLGRGSMGEVYRATQFGSDEKVAIKILRGDVADEPDLLGRFLRERSLLLSLDDASLVRVRDLVVEGGSAAIVMDLMEGGDLRGLMDLEGEMDPVRAATLSASVFGALGIVHGAGILHRDVKPENLLFDGSQNIHLADFGIAKFLNYPQYTQTIGVFGTPAYMAPETGLKDEVSPASDVYSGGIVLFEMIAGHTPFQANSPLAMMRLHADEEVVYPETIPRAMRNFLATVLAKEPSSRPSALEAKDDLVELLSSKKLSSSPKRVTKRADASQSQIDGGAEPVTLLVQETIMSNRRSLGLSERIPPAQPASLNETQKVGTKTKVGTPTRQARGRHRLDWRWVALPALLLVIGIILAFLLSSTRPQPVPSTPQGLAVALSPTHALEVTWEAPLHNGSSVAKYHVVADVGNARSTSTVDRTGNAEYSAALHQRVTGGEQVSISVTMENAQGHAIGKKATFVGVVELRPSAPVIHAQLIGKSIVITWHVSTDNGGAITRFQVTDNHDSKFDFSGSTHEYVLKSPIAGSTYRFRISAENSAGESHSQLSAPIVVPATTKTNPSTTTSTSTPSAPPLAAKPHAPTNLRVFANGQRDGVTFSWTDPNDVEGYVLDTTAVSITSATGATIFQSNGFGLRSRSIDVAIATSGQYTFKVTAEFVQKSNKRLLLYSTVLRETATVSSTQTVTFSR